MELTVRDLSFRYSGAEDDTIKRLNFTVIPGEVFGFLGRKEHDPEDYDRTSARVSRRVRN